MNTEELYSYILGAFEGKSFENIMLNKSNSDFKPSFDEKREEIINKMNTDEYSKLIELLSKSFMSNIAKGTNSSSFSKDECDEILGIYHKLIENISNYDMDYEKIAIEHYINVKNFITEYTSENKESKEETSYSPETILKVLDIDISNMTGKALDIGCGRKGNFVKYLRENNIEAYGIDMNCDDSETLEQEDWLDKEYPENTYDLITSNLTFTKFFNNANIDVEADDECYEYAKAYMKILNSLKVGGKWHYVPAVPFMEELLPEDKFEVTNSFVHDGKIMRTLVKRIK